MNNRVLLSRAADSVYWMSRYVERAENVARTIEVNLALMLDLPVEKSAQWRPLIQITGDDELFDSNYPEASQENVIKFLAFDLENPNSILSCITSARENARSVREIISTEMWEQLNQFYLEISGKSQGLDLAVAPQEFFYDVRMRGHLFEGLSNATMTHGEAWHFGRIGRLLERADKTSRILDVKYFILLPSTEAVGSPFDDIHWAAVLKSVSGFEMYRKKHGRLSPRNIVDFLLLDREFPRAVHSCLIRADESLSNISGSSYAGARNSAEKTLGQLRSEMDFADVDNILLSGLHEYIDTIQLKINQVGESIFNTFFALRPLTLQTQIQQ